MWLAIGIVIGIILSVLAVFFFTSSGTLRVYIPEPNDEAPYLYVDLDKSIGYICRQKFVVFRVDVRNLKSHK